MSLIDLLRHGEPLGGRMFRGHGVDHALSETGWQQMWAALADARPWTQVVSSPLQRCRAFAESLHQQYALPFVVDERLREIGFGQWEGCTPELLAREQPQAYAAYRADPAQQRPPGAESAAAFYARVAEALDAIVQQYAQEHVLVIAHAGVLRAALVYAGEGDLSGQFRVPVAYAARLRLHIDAKTRRAQWVD